uniref:Uncharacterized protein n=2 Tax=Cupriavidus pinatubonensis TaxID=248026 RepID=Q46XL4_CUPPJ
MSSLLSVTRPIARRPFRLQSPFEVIAMKKLIAALVVGLFATGAFAQASAPAAADAAPAAKEAPKAQKKKTSHKKHHAKKSTAAASAPAAQ